MKFLIASLALIAVASAQQYGQAVQQEPIAILRQAADVAPDGSYNYNYETENGISASEDGQLTAPNAEGEQAVVVRGQYSYTAPDGVRITVRYIADENGFQPEGAHLPVAPAVPEAIARSLAHNRANPQEDDYLNSQLPQRQQKHYNRRF